MTYFLELPSYANRGQRGKEGALESQVAFNSITTSYMVLIQTEFATNNLTNHAINYLRYLSWPMGQYFYVLTN